MQHNENYTYNYNSPLGRIIFSSDGEFLTGLWFENQAHFPKEKLNTYIKKFLPIFEETIKWLEIYFSGKNPAIIPSLKYKSTEFRNVVWEELLLIPFGTTKSYKEIAKSISEKQGGKFVSPRAVGGAVGRNPISIIIPCHRVVGSKDTLTGYAGGIERKKALLDLEGKLKTLF
jgi:methylated-DNA-[protein]-cysteine S-methyltransferase